MPQFRVDASLPNAKEPLRVVCHFLIPDSNARLHRSGPAQGTFHGIPSYEKVRWIGGALIECHDDVGAQGLLNLNRFLR